MEGRLGMPGTPHPLLSSAALHCYSRMSCLLLSCIGSGVVERIEEVGVCTWTVPPLLFFLPNLPF
jgi:hypothetical protein